MRIQFVQYRAPAPFAVWGLLAAIEESGLIGEDKSRSGTFGKHLYGAQGGGNPRVAPMHGAGGDDACIRHDVQIAPLAGVEWITLRPEAGRFAATDTKVLFVSGDFPIVSGHVP